MSTSAAGIIQGLCMHVVHWQAQKINLITEYEVPKTYSWSVLLLFLTCIFKPCRYVTYIFMVNTSHISSLYISPRLIFPVSVRVLVDEAEVHVNWQ